MLKKDLAEEIADEKVRTDLVRTKLARKAFSIPQVILKQTQRVNTIKDLNETTAEPVYRK